MFIYNFKVNGGIILRIIIIVLSLFMLGVFLFSVYRIFFTSGKFRVEDTLEANDANEKVSDFMQDIVQDMKTLQRTDRNYNIHFGGEDNYMYKHSETGKSNLKNVLNSLTYLER